MGRKSRRKGKQVSTENPKTLRAESSPSRLVPINERLELPAYRAEEEAEDEDEEEELQLEYRPRLYFAASLCYLCGAGFEPEERVPCPGCQLVAYCSEEHRLADRPQHGQLCDVLAELSQALGVAAHLGPDQFRQLRLRLLQLAEEALARRLEPREREPLLYPRLCRTCHCAHSLTECPECRMELFCPEHRPLHLPHCAELRLFRGLLLAQRKAGSVAPPIPPGYPAPGQPLPASFDLLVREAFGPGPRYLRIDAASYAALSQAASPALTAAAAAKAHLHQRGNQSLLTIHVIGAELQFECANVAVWEKLFLHFLPGVKCLRLEFCGPELHVPPDIASLLERPRLCSSCRANNRKINIVFHCGKLYHELVNDKPDLVCLFNPGLYRTTGFSNQDTWPQTIKKFCDYGSPILVTSYTEVELPRDLARICEFRKLQVEQEPRRNPFASLKPERNFVSDDVAPLIYKNYFFSVARGILNGCTKMQKNKATSDQITALRSFNSRNSNLYNMKTIPDSILKHAKRTLDHFGKEKTIKQWRKSVKDQMKNMTNNDDCNELPVPAGKKDLSDLTSSLNYKKTSLGKPGCSTIQLQDEIESKNKVVTSCPGTWNFPEPPFKASVKKLKLEKVPTEYFANQDDEVQVTGYSIGNGEMSNFSKKSYHDSMGQDKNNTINSSVSPEELTATSTLHKKRTLQQNSSLAVEAMKEQNVLTAELNDAIRIRLSQFVTIMGKYKGKCSPIQSRR